VCAKPVARQRWLANHTLILKCLLAQRHSNYKLTLQVKFPLFANFELFETRSKTSAPALESPRLTQAPWLRSSISTLKLNFHWIERSPKHSGC